MTAESPKPPSPQTIETTIAPPAITPTTATPTTPAITPTPITPAADTAKSSELLSGTLPQSPEEATQWLEKGERFAKLVAENLRYGSWTKRFVTIGGVAVVALNPVSAGKVGELFGVKALPSWYSTAFGLGLSGLAVGAVGAAVVTLPKRRSPEITPERQAIKGLRSFELKDAEIFKQLERQKDVQECLDALRDPELRLAILTGESGAGKSSLLQAGLMPRLAEANFQGVYVKLGDRDPVSLIRRALAAPEDEALVPMLTNAVARMGKPIVLILDQFEQFFVQFQEAERAGFIEALKAWYASGISVKLLIGIRGDLSDRLIEIQKALGYALRPAQVYRLEKFTPMQATAVLKVIAETEGLSFNQQFVTQVSQEELAGRDGKVSPVDVQILAQMLSRETEEANRIFDRQAFQRLGGVDGLLGRSLTRSLDKILSKSERERTLEVLLALTDLEQNVRSGAFSLEQLQAMPEKVHGLPSEVAAAVDWLLEARLVTPVEQGGAVAYELAHERLILALRQVANQELTAANRANLLLDRRVNEWLGSGKKQRYLFSLLELRLLQQQRGFLHWGQREAQKRDLLYRSRWRAGRNLGLLGLPVVLGIGFGIWSHTPPGQIQWASWQLMDLARLMDLDQYSSSQPSNPSDIFTAVTLDAVGAAQAPLPLAHYFGWEAPTSKSMGDSLAKTAAMLGDLKDQQRATQLLRQVLVVVQANHDPSAKTTALSSIAEASIKLNDRDRAKQLVAQAIEAAKSIKEESDQITALISIAEASIKLNDRDRAKQLVAQAIEAAKSIKEESDQTTALISIAEASIKLNDRNRARQLVAQALQIAKSTSNDKFSQFTALISIAEASIKLNDRDRANQLVAQALQIAKSSNNEFLQVYVLSNIATVYIKLKDDNQAIQLIAQALQIAKSIKEEDSQVQALSNIATVYIKLKDDSQATQLIAQALQIAKSIKDESSQANTLSDIATVYIKLKDGNQATQLIAQALQIAKSIKDEFFQADALKNIAAAASTLKDGKQAKQILNQAFQIAKSIKEEDSQAQALSSIAAAASTLKDQEQAKTILSQTTQIVETSQSSRVISSFAEAYAELGNWGEALRLVQRCSGNDKVAVLARILRVHAEQQNPEFKALREKKADEE